MKLRERTNSLGKRAAVYQYGAFDACFRNRVSVAQANDGDLVYASRDERFHEGPDAVAVSIPFGRCNELAVRTERAANPIDVMKERFEVVSRQTRACCFFSIDAERISQ